MPHSDTGGRVTRRARLPVARRARRSGHPRRLRARQVYARHSPAPGRRVRVRDRGSVAFGLDDGEPVVLKAGESFYEPPGALHSLSRNTSRELPASLIAFFVLGDGECPTVNDRD
jgi:Cupin domain